MTNETPQPNANIHRQSRMEITAFVDLSGEGSAALITAWLKVRVLPGHHSRTKIFPARRPIFPANGLKIP